LKLEGFSCSLDVPQGGLRKKLQFLIDKKFFPAEKFQTFIIKTLNTEPELDPDPH
jgi:hypothetical protein